MKIFTPLLFLAIFLLPLSAQETKSHDFRAGLIFQRSHYLYLENGIGFDYSNERILQKQLHLKAAYVSSRFGSAIESNAI
ncbi:MAG: hypothetical protein PHR62_15790, partial [Paludibacter sp.]|nr:hypothetical protein [Paludibacter sp.]